MSPPSSSTLPEPQVPDRSERAVVLLISAVQFVNILEFMIVMPLGPDFAQSLGIPESDLGIIGGSYMAAASVAGLVGASFLDRFDRRKALGVAMTGLVLATLLGGLSSGWRSLILARVLAGSFGGPATSLAVAVITDVIPPARRGKAIGAVMSSFSVASVVGVPAGLWLAELWGWRSTFFAVGGLGAVVALGAVFLLPSLRGHLKAGPSVSTLELLRRPLVWVAFAMTALAMSTGFLLIPNISAYVQGNLEYPRDGLKWLYLAGGLTSFVSMRVVGGAVDRYGATRVGALGALLVGATIFTGFYLEPPPYPVLLVYVLFMGTMSVRNISFATLSTKVPEQPERARFQSLQSTVQHAASGLTAMVSSRMLTERPLLGPGGAPRLSAEGKPLMALVGFPRLAALAMGLTLLLPLLVWWVEVRVRRRDATATALKG